MAAFHFGGAGKIPPPPVIPPRPTDNYVFPQDGPTNYPLVTRAALYTLLCVLAAVGGYLLGRAQ